MSSEIKPNSIFNFTIDSVKDIQNALECVEQQVSNILDCDRYGSSYIYSTETAVDNLDVVYVFDSALYHSEGFLSYSQITTNKALYQTEIADALVACNDLTPLFLSSFKCHQKALVHYMHAGQANELAMAEMAETGEIAQAISNRYKELSIKFRLLADQGQEAMRVVGKEQQPLYTRLQKLEADKKCEKTTDPLEEEKLRAGIFCLENSLKSLSEIPPFLLKVYIFLKNASQHSGALAQPALADLDTVKKMGLEVSEEEEKYYKQLEVYEKAKLADAVKPPSSLTEVVQSMKTGYDRVKTSQPKTPMTNSVKAGRLGSIDQEFEKSYLNWLALAKINQAMITAMKDILQKM